MSDSAAGKKLSRFQTHKTLILRVVSAVAMTAIAIVLGAIGGYPFFVFILLVGAFMLREWLRMVMSTYDITFVSISILFFSLFLAGYFYFGTFWAVLALIGLGCVSFIRTENIPTFFWIVAGIAFCAVFCVSVLSLRNASPSGFYICLLIQIVCSATDMGGYAFGKTFGGPKLMPSVSPNKTWAGFVGGFVLAIAAGIGITQIFGNPWQEPIVLTAIVIASASMVGDMFESYFKRQHDVKDTGTMIPGHGGVLDRVDSSVGGFSVVFLLGAAGVLFLQAEGMLP